KLLKFGFAFTGSELAVLLLGMAVAFAVSLAAIRFLMNYVKHHNFKIFGYYRIALGLAVLGYFLLA
ncbi:MAG: undecaprenyl-diphosphate phosphatase, partial [Anaerovoracaceae bacterium]